MDIAAAAITTDGPGAGAITNGVIIAAGKLFAAIRYRHPIARAQANFSDANGSRPQRRGRFSDFPVADGAQPNPISTAIRIRSE